MSDLISRQAVNKIIDKWLSNPFYELKDHIYEMTKKIHELPSVENKGEWIPISERLPEEDGCYLVAVKFDRYISNEICYFDADDRERPFCPTRTNAGSQYINHGYPIEKTLAWTYSPEPYKAESEEQ